MIRTRRATRRDIPSLVDVNVSDVDEWHHIDEHGRGAEASYEELSEWERVMHGGPWMSLPSLRRYWFLAQRWGIVCLVAEMEGRVVGHLDVLRTKEKELGPYLCLDVFMVHRSFRRRGVGSDLLRAAERLAIERGLPKMIVLADYEGPGGLTYRKFGFEPFLEMCTLETEVRDASIPPGVRLMNPPNEPPLDSHHVLSGWFTEPSKLWKSSFDRWDDQLGPFEWHTFILSALTDSGTAHFLLTSCTPCNPKRHNLDVCIWTPPSLNEVNLNKAVQTMRTIAGALGAEVLTTLAFEKDRRMLEAVGFSWVKRHDPLLAKDTIAKSC